MRTVLVLATFRRPLGVVVVVLDGLRLATTHAAADEAQRASLWVRMRLVLVSRLQRL